MGWTNKQIGWSQESILLQEIIKKLVLIDRALSGGGGTPPTTSSTTTIIPVTTTTTIIPTTSTTTTISITTTTTTTTISVTTTTTTATTIVVDACNLIFDDEGSIYEFCASCGGSVEFLHIDTFVEFPPPTKAFCWNTNRMIVFYAIGINAFDITLNPFTSNFTPGGANIGFYPGSFIPTKGLVFDPADPNNIVICTNEFDHSVGTFVNYVGFSTGTYIFGDNYSGETISNILYSSDDKVIFLSNAGGNIVLNQFSYPSFTQEINEIIFSIVSFPPVAIFQQLGHYYLIFSNGAVYEIDLNPPYTITNTGVTFSGLNAQSGLYQSSMCNAPGFNV